MKRLIFIMAHSEVQDTFQRHLPYWEANGKIFMVVCPRDSLVVTEYPVLAWGNKGHHNPDAVYRFAAILSLAHKMLPWYQQHGLESVWIFEYDSLSLSTDLPRIEPDHVYGNVFHDSNPAWRGKSFIHPPLAFGPDALKRVRSTIDHVGLNHTERNFWDRWLGWMLELSGITPVNWMPIQGFSHNTIEKYHLPSAVQAAKEGVSLFHGVKSKEVLDELARNYVS